MAVIFQTVGDGELLRHLYRYRFLQTKLFSLLTGRSPAVIRRRLRALKEMGYVFSFARLATDEAVYALAGLGFKYIADELGVSVRDIPYSRKNSQVRPHSLFHSLQTIKFAVNAELGLQEHDSLDALDFFPEWKHQNAAAKLPEERYFIKERVFIDEHRSLPCHPDAVLTVDYGGRTVAFYVESDRASEDMKRLLNKFEAYRLLHRQGLYREKFGADTMVVLFTLSRIKTARRIHSMQKTLQDFVENFSDDQARLEAASFAKRVLFVEMEDLMVESVWTEPIWRNWQNEEKSLYTPKPVPEETREIGLESECSNEGDKERITVESVVTAPVTADGLDG